MYKQEISISINSRKNKQTLLEAFELLLMSYASNGQIQKSYESPYVHEGKIVSFAKTLERTSLSRTNNNEYAKMHLKTIEQLCDAKVSTTVVAKYPLLEHEVCTCKTPRFFVLFTHVFLDASPVECGDCKKAVPIYKLKWLPVSDRQNILDWETNYKSCDELQLGCTVGEKWAVKQMSDYSSELSKQGIAICNRITEVTGKPALYYLFNDAPVSAAADSARKCPSCNGDWQHDGSIHDFYPFLCQRCRLVSSFTSNPQ